jgi:hypothetical protein
VPMGLGAETYYQHRKVHIACALSTGYECDSAAGGVSTSRECHLAQLRRFPAQQIRLPRMPHRSCLLDGTSVVLKDVRRCHRGCQRPDESDSGIPSSSPPKTKMSTVVPHEVAGWERALSSGLKIQSDSRRFRLGMSKSRLARLTNVSRFKICTHELGDT